jgi:L-rhamnose mutarotase
MEGLMRRAGMRNYSIWHCGNELIGYYEYLGMDKKLAAYDADRQISNAGTNICPV